MATMTLDEARKYVQADKPKENYMILPFGYDQKLVVPYKDGVTIISALINAELYVKQYGSPTQITSMEVDCFTPTILSKEEYQRIKMGMLLNVHPDSLKDSKTP